MKQKSTLIFLSILVGLILLTGVFSAGLWLGYRHGQSKTQAVVVPPTVTSSNPTAQPTQQTILDLFKPFWQAWDLVHQEYVDQPVDDTKMMQGAINGMMQSLGDPHSSYMNPDELRQADIALEGSYEGIGAWVDPSGDYLTIISPMSGSPAERAGLKAKDQVIKIDGVDMTGTDPNVALTKVLGPAGTQVTLTISRPGLDTPFDVTLTREQITIPSVEGEMKDGNIAYIKLSTFGTTTADDLHKKLEELLANNPKGLILDLRGNTGGYLDTAISIVSEFISNGTVLIEESGNGQQTTYDAKPGGLATTIPMVVLVNEGSASASEITAGAIQDYKRAPLVGVTTYGKGSVQQWINLDNDQGAVRITIARWLTPFGRQINKLGLKPDYEIEITQADIDAKLDPQLAKAIEILTQIK
jgi:carboxyl-terminal processing protease